MRWIRAAVLVVGAAGAAVALSACHGGAHLFVVNTAVDGPDAVPGDEVCEMTPGVGDCSLRAAIDETNAHIETGSVAIEPGLGPIVLTVGGVGEDGNATGDLDITRDVTIIGNGATIDASGLAIGDRVLHVHEGANATFVPDGISSFDPLTPSGSDVVTTVTGGDLRSQSSATTSSWGAGIFNEGVLTAEGLRVDGNETLGRGGGIATTGDLTVIGSTVSSNAAGSGGGIVTGLALDLEITDAVVTGNEAANGGGGLFVNSTGATDIDGSTFAANSTPLDGGGLLLWGSGPVTVTDSVVTDNEGDRSGGGIHSQTVLTVEGVEVTGNRSVPAHAQDGGAGIRNEGGSLTVVDATIAGNASGDVGGGLRTDGGSVVIDRSTISGNASDRMGVAIYSDGSALSLLRSTVSDNVGTSVPNDRKAIFVDVATGEPVRIAASTIVANSGQGLSWDGDPAGGPMTVGGSVIAGHVDGDCRPGKYTLGAPPFTSLGYDLDSDGTCLAVATGPGDVTTSAFTVGLGPLGTNGGPTQTHLPTGWSPLVDAIPPGTAGLCDAALPVDQRGQPHPAGAGCDIGAVERQPSDP